MESSKRNIRHEPSIRALVDEFNDSLYQNSVTSEAHCLSIIEILYKSGFDFSSSEDAALLKTMIKSILVFCGNGQNPRLLGWVLTFMNKGILSNDTPHFWLYIFSHSHTEENRIMPSVINKLLDVGMPVNISINHFPCDKMTLIQYATYYGDVETVRTLLARKADITVKTNEGETLLHLAMHRYQPEIVSMLIESGVDIHTQDGAKYTPLALLLERIVGSKEPVDKSAFTVLTHLLNLGAVIPTISFPIIESALVEPKNNKEKNDAFIKKGTTILSKLNSKKARIIQSFISFLTENAYSSPLENTNLWLKKQSYDPSPILRQKSFSITKLFSSAHDISYQFFIDYVGKEALEKILSNQKALYTCIDSSFNMINELAHKGDSQLSRLPNELMIEVAKFAAPYSNKC